MINFNEEQILSLKFDSQAFVEGVDDAIDIINSLNSTIKTFKSDSSTVGSKLSSVFGSITSVLTVFSKHSEGILSDIFKGFSKFSENINSEANSVDFSKINSGLESTGYKFSAFEELVRGIFIRLGSQITDFAEKKIKLLTVDQAMAGWEKYQTLVKKTQTMMATGANEEEVTTALRQLAWYADETSYSLEDMVANLSKFVSYGISVGDAATEIMGIDNAVAKAGSSIQQATSAQEAFARAFSMGYMSLSVWRHQLTTSGLITEDFKNKCIEAGLEVGTLYKDVNGIVRTVNKDMKVTATGMENTLTETAWMTKDVMETMLKGYAASAKEIEYIYQNTSLTTSEIMEAGKEFFDQYSLEAFQMGQEALTLEQSIESLWDAVSTQWANIFTNIFGTYNDAKILWTDLANWLNEIFVTPFYNLVDFTSGFKTTLEEDGGYLVKYRKLVEEECGLISNVFTETSGTIQEALREGFLNILRAISSYVDAFKLAWNAVFNSATIKQVGDLVGSFTNFTEKLILSDDQVVKLASNLANLFKIIKIVKDIIVEIYKAIRDFLEPIIRKLFDYILPILDRISDSLSNVLLKIQTFLKNAFGIEFKNTSILKEFQKLNDSSANLLDNIETIKKKLKEYRDANPDVKSVTDNLTDLESKIKDINALTSAATMSKLTDFDVNKLQDLTASLAKTSGYLDKGSTLLKKYTDELDAMKKQGYATYENLEKVNSILKELNGELNKNYIFEDLNKINWSNLTDEDIKNLRAYNEELKTSNIYVSEAEELSEKYKQKLESIGKAGKVTASDLKELDDILNQMSKTEKTREELSKTSDEIVALQYAIDKIRSKDKIDDKDIAVLEELYNRLEKAEKKSNNSSKALDELSGVLKEVGKSSELTASDIDKISDALDTLKGKVEEENETEKEAELERERRRERMQRYQEAVAESENLTDKEKIEYWSKYWQEESKSRRKDAEELNKQNQAKKEANALVKESLNTLKTTTDYSSKAFKNVDKLSKVSSDISETIKNVNGDVSDLNANSENATKAIDKNKKSVDELSKSEKKLDSSIKDTNKTSDSSKVPEKIDKVKDSSKEAETWVSKLANGLKSIFTSTAFETSKDDVSNSISEIGNKLADASANAEKVEKVSKSKKLSDYINDWLGKLDISKGNIAKILLGVTVFTIAVKKIYEDLGKIAQEKPEIFSQASKNIMAMGFALVEVSAAISLIMTSEYLFGSSENAINAVTKIFKLLRNTLFVEFIALGIFKRKLIKDASLTFIAMGFALIEASAAIAIVNKILKDNANGETAIKAVMDLLKEFRKLIVQVSLLSKESSASTILASTFLIISFSVFIGSLGAALYLIERASNDYAKTYKILLGIIKILKTVSACIDTLALLAKAGTEREILASSSMIIAFSIAILSIGAAVSAMAWINSKNENNDIKKATKSIRSIIEQLKDCVRSIIIFSGLYKHADLENVDKVFYSLSAVIFSIGVAVSAITYVDGLNKNSNTKKATKSIRSIIEQLKDCVRSLIIFSSLYKHSDLKNIDKVFYSLSVAIFSIGVAISAITYVDGLNENNDIKKATKSVRSIIEQLKDCVRSFIIFSGLFKSNYNTLESTSYVFYSLSACLIAMSGSIAIITYVYSKYGKNVKKSVKVLISCIDQIKELAISLIIFSSIFNKGNEYSADKIKAIAKDILALSVPILAIGATISLISYFDSKYGNTEPAMENLILMLKEIVKVGKIIAFMSSIFGGIELPFAPDKSSWITKLGLAMIEISFAVGLVAQVYNKYGKTVTDDAFESIKGMILSLGVIGGVLIVAGGAAGRLGGKAGANSKAVRNASNTLLAIGFALLEVSAALAIVAGIRKLVGDENEFKESTKFIQWAIIELGVVGGILIAVAGGFHTKENQITRASALMISIGTSLLEVSAALGIVAHAYKAYGGDAIAEALYDIGVMLFAMGTTVAALMYLANLFEKNNVTAKVGILGLGFIAISTALLEAAVAISVVAYVSSITDNSTTTAMYTLATMMFAMAIVITAMAYVANEYEKVAGKVIIFSVAMNIIGIAMNIFATALDKLAFVYKNYGWFTVAAAATLVTMIGCFGLILDGLAALGAKWEVESKFVIVTAIAIPLMSIALKPMVNALDVIGEIRNKYGNEKTIWELVGIAIAVIGGLAAILGALTAAAAMIGTESGMGGGFISLIELASSGAIVLLSIGLGYLADALQKMQNVDWTTIIKSGIALNALATAIAALSLAATAFWEGALIIYGGFLVLAIALRIAADAFRVFSDAWVIFKNEDSVNTTVTVLQNTEEEYRTGGDSIYDAAKEAGLKGPVGLGDGINENKDVAITSARDLVRAVVNKMHQTLGLCDEKGNRLPDEDGIFYKNGQFIVQGLALGIQAECEKGDIVNTVQDFGELCVTTFSESVGVESPSTVFYKIAQFIIAGLINGIKDKDSVNSTKMAMTSLALDAVVSPVTKVVEDESKADGKLTKAGEEATKAVADGASNEKSKKYAFKSLSEFFGSLIGFMTGTIFKDFGLFDNLDLSSMIDTTSLQNQINSAVGDIKLDIDSKKLSKQVSDQIGEIDLSDIKINTDDLQNQINDAFKNLNINTEEIESAITVTGGELNLSDILVNQDTMDADSIKIANELAQSYSDALSSEDVQNKVIEGASTITDSTVEGMKKTSKGRNLFDAVVDIVSIICSTYIKALEIRMPLLQAAFAKMVNVALNVKLFMNKAISLGSNIVNGIARGINTSYQKVKQAAINISNIIKNAFKSFFKIHSPSRVMKDLGENVVDGLLVGISGEEDKAADAASSFATAFNDEMEDSLGVIMDYINSDFEYTPTITPVVNLDNIETAKSYIDNAFTSNASARTSSSFSTMQKDKLVPKGEPYMPYDSNKAPSYTYVQNNYSPKALDPIEIYRRTKNQLKFNSEMYLMSVPPKL